MRLLSTTALAGIIALAMAGCGSSEESNVAVQPPPSVLQPSQQPEPKTEAKSSQESTLVAQKPIDTKPSVAPGLIQPTNPNQRTQQVQKGRSDPFAGLFTIAPPKVVVKPQVVPPSPKPPAAPPPPPQPIAIQPAPRPIAPPPPPSPPQPDIARGITVFGVVQVGDRYQAIVQVPTEATSRYVNEGQRLSDGQVLVKSIELNPGSEPVVVLEQNGIEVTRAVGEEPAKTADNNASTTSSSMTSTLPVTNSSVAEVNNIRLQDGSPNAIPAPPPPASKRSPAAAVPPPPPAVEPSSEAVQSHSRLGQPPSVTSALPSTLASNPLSGVVDESQLDANYPPPAVRDAEMPQGHSKVESLKKRQNLQRYRQLVNRLKMGR